MSEKLKLAFVSPMPPEKSGISYYSQELIPFLKKYYEIEIIVDQKEISKSARELDCIFRSKEYFMENHKKYDRIIYQFGNSAYHKHMFDLLSKIPGVVTLHDFYISDVVAYLNATSYKDFLSQEIYASHGYDALIKVFKNKAKISDYPVNDFVFRNSKGIIVHSNFSKKLSIDWYGEQVNDFVKVVPHLEAVQENIAKTEARKKLNLPQDKVIICSFGYINENKQSKKIFEAWKKSYLAKDNLSMLFFVGAGAGEENNNVFFKNLKLETSLTLGQANITGWTSDEDYKLWMQAADIAIQLRTNSRGETSGAVLDCLSYGLPLIINANGSFKEIPESSAIVLDDNFTDDSLTEALHKLYEDKELLSALSKSSKEFIAKNNNPELIASLYNKEIENFYSLQFINSKNSFKKKQILVDISQLVVTDLKTGIQRVVKSFIKNLIENCPPGYNIRPVYISNGNPYKYANRFTLNLLGYNVLNNVHDDPVTYNEGDILFCPDHAQGIVAKSEPIYNSLKIKGVKIIYIIYDLLPIIASNFFPNESIDPFKNYFNVIVKKADAIIGISKTVANDIHSQILKNKPNRNSSLKIGWNHLGSDIDSSLPSRGIMPKVLLDLNNLKNKPTVLMVGTVEPRKGYDDALKACENLWKKNIDFNLVIIGKRGWMVDSLVKKINSHQKLNKNLFWYDNVSDEALEMFYKASGCLLMASRGEGFGLPIIEAAKYNKPIIARDIPVFKEVCGSSVKYFSNVENLSETIYDWIRRYQSHNYEYINQINLLTWKESVLNFIKMIRDENHPNWIYNLLYDNKL